MFNLMHDIFLKWVKLNEPLFLKENIELEYNFFEDSMGDRYECFIRNKEYIVILEIYGDHAGGGYYLLIQDFRDDRYQTLNSSDLYDALERIKSLFLATSTVDDSGIGGILTEEQSNKYGEAPSGWRNLMKSVRKIDSLIRDLNSETSESKREKLKTKIRSRATNPEARSKILLWDEGDISEDLFEIQSLICFYAKSIIGSSNLPSNLRFHDNANEFIGNIESHQKLTSAEKRIVLLSLRTTNSLEEETSLKSVEILKKDFNKTFRERLPVSLRYELDKLIFLSKYEELYDYNENIKILTDEKAGVHFILPHGKTRFDDFSKAAKEFVLRNSQSTTYLWTVDIDYCNELANFARENNFHYSYTGFDNPVKEKIRSLNLQNFVLIKDKVIKRLNQDIVHDIPFYIGGIPQQNATYTQYPLWPHVMDEEKGDLLPLKFVGRVKDKREILYLFYSTPGYENEDESYSPTDGYNAVLTESHIPDKVKMMPLLNNEVTEDLTWSTEVVPFEYNKIKKDIKKYKDSVDFISSAFEMGKLKLRIIIPSGFNDWESFSFGDGESLMVLEDTDNKYYITISNL